MGDIVNLASVARLHRPVRDNMPESGAAILLFTGVQYVRPCEAERTYALPMGEAGEGGKITVNSGPGRHNGRRPDARKN